MSAQAVNAQQATVKRAVAALQAQNLDEAQLLIDSAATHPETIEVATTWYYRGYIYKAIYNAKEKSDPASAARLQAIDSYKKFLELDTEGELTESNNKSLKYLATTLFNDAATTLNPNGYEQAIVNYELYKKTLLAITPDANFEAKDIQFQLVVGSVFTQIYEMDREKNKSFFNKVRDAYLFVLDIDSVDVSANYNLGTLYYNEGVHIIKSLDYETDIITLELIQDECVELFRKALPYLQKAYNLNPKRKETLIGLAGIYFSLNEMEKSERVQSELKLLEEDD